MQMHPDVGGYPLHRYPAMDDHDDYYLRMDDYHYNSNAFPRHSMDDYHYNGNAFPRHSMQIVPDKRVPLQKQNTMRDYFCYKGSSIQKSPDQWIPLQKHSYSHMDGYTPYDHYDDNNFKHGRGDYYSAQYPQVWPEKEQPYEQWNNKNGYLVHADYKGSTSPDVETSGEYRTVTNEHRPYNSELNKASPAWVPRGIRN